MKKSKKKLKSYLEKRKELKNKKSPFNVYIHTAEGLTNLLWR